MYIYVIIDSNDNLERKCGKNIPTYIKNSVAPVTSLTCYRLFIYQKRLLKNKNYLKQENQLLGSHSNHTCLMPLQGNKPRRNLNDSQNSFPLE